MKKYIISIATIGVIALSISAYNSFPQVKSVFGVLSDPFLSIQLATSPSNGNCLTTDGTNNAWGSCGSGGGGTFPFTVNSWGNSTTTTLGLLNGFLSTASSTISAPLRLSSLGQGFLFTGSGGLVQPIASSSVRLSWFNNDAGFITSAVTSVTGTYPIVSSGGNTPNITFSGLGTTTNSGMSQGNLYVGSGGIFQTSASSSIFGFTPASNATTITVAGTANQITSSAGAQDLSANRTWTLSFPNQVIFPQYASSTSGFSTQYASSTFLFGNNLTTCDPTTGKLTWASGQFGCGTDQSGSGLSSYDAWTHPASGISATTSQLTVAGLLSTASSTFSGGLNISKQRHDVTTYGAVCDGSTDDTTAITNAIAKGGVTVFPSGTCMVSGLTMLSGTHLLGVGTGNYSTPSSASQRTIIKLINSSNTDVISIPAGVSYGSIQNIEIDGNKANQTSGMGINMADAVSSEESGWRLINVEVYNADDNGVYIGSNRLAVYSEHLRIIGSDEHGLQVNGSDGTYIKTMVGTSGFQNIVAGGFVNRFIGGDTWSGTLNGIVVTGSMITIDGMGIDRNQRNGIVVDTGALNVSILGNQFHSNGQATDNTYSDINVTASNVTTIVGNSFAGLDSGITNKRKYAIDTNGSNIVTQSNNNYVSSASGTGFTDVGANASLILPTGTFIKSGANVIFGGNGFNTLFRPDSSGGEIQFQSFAGATHSIFSDTGSLSVGTTTIGIGKLVPFSSTAPQLSLSAGAGLSQWTMRNAGGNLYLATTTVAGTATTSTAAFSILNTGEVIVRNIFQIFNVAGTKIMDVTASLVTLLGTWDFGGATSLEIPNATSPTLGAGGILALDTTANNLIMATSTDGHFVVAGATTTLASFTVASTSVDFVSGGIIPIPAHYLQEVAVAVICSVEGGTSQQIFFSDGTNDTNTVTCTTTEAQYALTTNNTWNAYETKKLEFATKSGSPDYLTVRLIGYRVSN